MSARPEHHITPQPHAIAANDRAAGLKVLPGTRRTAPLTLRLPVAQEYVSEKKPMGFWSTLAVMTVLLCLAPMIVMGIVSLYMQGAEYIVDAVFSWLGA